MKKHSQLPVEISPSIFKWARLRADLSMATVANKIGVSVEKITEYEHEGVNLSYAKSCTFAKMTYIPWGYLFLDEPVEENLGIVDFRSRTETNNHKPSANLLDIVSTARQQQSWYRGHVLRESGDIPIPCLQVDYTSDSDIAWQIRDFLRWDDLQFSCNNPYELMRKSVEIANSNGVLVSRSGKVGDNVYRKLDPREFRGFAIFDEYAPLIFINIRGESINAQIFTLAHELAHLFRRESGIDSAVWDVLRGNEQSEEAICNKIAAEALMPEIFFDKEWEKVGNDAREIAENVSRKFKVSVTAAIIRAYNRGFIDKVTLDKIYSEEKAKFLKFLDSLAKTKSAGSGGNYYNTLFARLPGGKKFARAVIYSTQVGALRYTDAFDLLNVSQEVFVNCAKRLGL